MFRRKLRPALEALENRDVPSVTMQTFNNGHTLKISGNGDWENVQIVENQQTGMLDISYYRMPKPNQIMELVINQVSYSSTQITKVMVDLKGGDDFFSYSLAEGSNLTSSRQWLIDMGAGNDTVKVDTAKTHTVGGEEASIGAVPDGEYWTIESPPTDYEKGKGATVGNTVDTGHSSIQAATGMTIQMGAGNDSLNIVLGEVNNRAAVRLTTMLGAGSDYMLLTSDYDVKGSGTVLVDVNAGDGVDEVSAQFNGLVDSNCLVDVLYRGGAGTDVMDVGFFGKLDGRLNVRMYGGSGMDKLSLITDTDMESTGLLSFMLLGQKDHDNMTYQTLGADDPTLVSALIDGGENRNNAWISRDIAVFNCTDTHRLAPMPPWGS